MVLMDRQRQIQAVAEAVGEEISRYAYAAYLYENEKKEENITAARTIRNVISCPGRNRPRSRAHSAAATWWKKETSWSARTSSAVMSWENRKLPKNNTSRVVLYKIKCIK